MDRKLLKARYRGPGSHGTSSFKENGQNDRALSLYLSVPRVTISPGNSDLDKLATVLKICFIFNPASQSNSLLVEMHCC